MSTSQKPQKCLKLAQKKKSALEKGDTFFLAFAWETMALHLHIIYMHAYGHYALHNLSFPNSNILNNIWKLGLCPTYPYGQVTNWAGIFL